MDVRRSLALLVLAAALAAGCGGGAKGPDAPRRAVGAEAAALAERALRAAALGQLVSAAGGGDERRMWAKLTRSTRRRLGPTLPEFRAGRARELRGRLAAFAHGSYRVILNEPIDFELAVVAIGGGRTVGGRREYGVFAAPLRLEQGAWRVQVDPSLTIEPVRPAPMERVVERTQLFAEVAAPGAIEEAGMWFDGIAFPARGFALDDRRHMSVWGEAPQPLSRGRHTVVAFASAGPNAAALAWAFTVTVPGHGSGSPYGG